MVLNKSINFFFYTTVLIFCQQSYCQGKVFRFMDNVNNVGIQGLFVKIDCAEKKYYMTSNLQGYVSLEEQCLDTLLVEVLSSYFFEESITKHFAINKDTIIINLECKDPVPVKLFGRNSFGKAKAIADIKENTIEILLDLGEVIRPKNIKDEAFEKKYNVKFVYTGDALSGGESIFNEIIFRYLDKTYGNEWRKDISGDTYYFKEYCRNNRINE